MDAQYGTIGEEQTVSTTLAHGGEKRGREVSESHPDNNNRNTARGDDACDLAPDVRSAAQKTKTENYTDETDTQHPEEMSCAVLCDDAPARQRHESASNVTVTVSDIAETEFTTGEKGSPAHEVVLLELSGAATSLEVSLHNDRNTPDTEILHHEKNDDGMDEGKTKDETLRCGTYTQAEAADVTAAHEPKAKEEAVSREAEMPESQVREASGTYTTASQATIASTRGENNENGTTAAAATVATTEAITPPPADAETRADSLATSRAPHKTEVMAKKEAVETAAAIASISGVHHSTLYAMNTPHTYSRSASDVSEAGTPSPPPLPAFDEEHEKARMAKQHAYPTSVRDDDLNACKSNTHQNT